MKLTKNKKIIIIMLLLSILLFGFPKEHFKISNKIDIKVYDIVRNNNQVCLEVDEYSKNNQNKKCLVVVDFPFEYISGNTFPEFLPFFIFGRKGTKGILNNIKTISLTIFDNDQKKQDFSKLIDTTTYHFIRHLSNKNDSCPYSQYSPKKRDVYKSFEEIILSYNSLNRAKEDSYADVAYYESKNSTEIPKGFGGMGLIDYERIFFVVDKKKILNFVNDKGKIENKKCNIIFEND